MLPRQWEGEAGLRRAHNDRFQGNGTRSGQQNDVYGPRTEGSVRGLAVGVPGELRGLQEAHKRYGRLPWKRLVQPSVELAKSATVSKELARRLGYFGKFMLDDPVWREIFVDEETGELKTEGDTFHRTAYARTLKTIADHGPDAFYSGTIAESLVNTTQANGGILTLQDLQDYSVVVRPALQGSWLGKKVFTTHAPTSGPVLLSILNMLSLIPDFASTPEVTSLNMHRFIETLKFGFGQRTELADPAFMSADDRARMTRFHPRRGTTPRGERYRRQDASVGLLPSEVRHHRRPRNDASLDPRLRRHGDRPDFYGEPHLRIARHGSRDGRDTER